jgi:hypothetical protein
MRLDLIAIFNSKNVIINFNYQPMPIARALARLRRSPRVACDSGELRR